MYLTNESAALVAAEGYAAEDVTSYVKKIESVTVDGTEYAATGKRAVKIIKEDGTIDTTALHLRMQKMDMDLRSQ